MCSYYTCTCLCYLSYTMHSEGGYMQVILGNLFGIMGHECIQQGRKQLVKVPNPVVAEGV